MSDGMYELGAWRAAQATAAKNAQAAYDLLASLNQANANIDHLNGVVRDQAAVIAELRARIAALCTDVAVQAADAAGSRAVIKAFKEAHPNSPLLVDTGKRFADGDAKTRVTLVYEQGFDAAARQLGIVNPEQHRED
ncbi:hypothetical protein [Belnapia rosea]|uniref:hypothetical protein n=1 Tax=Belnapia rosea TaxID=938405 RepID=UPI000890A111|nr:hypothetical protein [Belnapia rosea]SDB22274.1 hypothetical protein SAMN02927895_00888 [Belnapia rosea]